MHAPAPEAAAAGSAVGTASPRLLAVKLADLGDSLTATPALRALRDSWPEARIDGLTSAAGAAALEGLTSVDELFVADKHAFDSPFGFSTGALRALAPLLSTLRARRYDQLLLLHHLTTPFGRLKYRLLTRAIGARQTVGLDNGHGRFLDVGVHDDGFGVRHEVDYAIEVAVAAGAHRPERPRLEIALDRAATVPILDERPSNPQTPNPKPQRIALHAGGGEYSLARRWPVERFAEVGRALASELGAGLVIVGGQPDLEAHRRLKELLGDGVRDFTAQTTIKATAAILEHCQLLVSNDSGVLNLAAAVDTPVVAIFGPSNDAAWGPYPPERHRVVRATLPCSPCFYRGKSLGQPQGCPTRDCLQLVAPEMVLAAARELLAEPAAVPA